MTSRLSSLVPVGARFEDRLVALVEETARISPAQVWVLAAVMVGLTGLADSLTGSQAWFGPLYLLAICVATWGIGCRAGIAVGIACGAITVTLNGAVTYPHPGLPIVWNLAMRIVAVLIIIALIGSVRRAFEREWRNGRRDGLTGLLNRQAFLEGCARKGSRGGWSMLCYVDLDGLKAINDRLGHAAGDEALRSFTGRVSAFLGECDLFARIGGDEFLLFLPVANESQGWRLARQLHAQMNRNSGDPCASIGASMGALLLGSDRSGVSDADIQLADEMMYEAKREGAALRIAHRSRCVDVERIPVVSSGDNAARLAA
ncbi:MAG: diguanylate cyclase [Alphaproteobacteria bacterium]|nr:diguanylate cyclase [Alphaproteobacteria bacterium]